MAQLAKFGLFAAAILVAVGCGDGPYDDTAATVHFSPLESQSLSARTIEQPLLATDDELEQVRPIIDGFEKNAARLLQRGDIDNRLPQIEAVFIRTGHFLDLVGIYQNAVETQGISSPAAPRLIWTLLRLGQRPQALGLIERLIADDPQEPMAWFLHGTHWLGPAAESEEAAARAIASYQRTLSLDSDFVGYDQLDAGALRQQISRLRQNASDAAVARADAELDTLADDTKQKLAADDNAEPGLAPSGALAGPDPGLAQGDSDGPATTSPDDQPDVKLVVPDNAKREPAQGESVTVTIARAELALAEDDRNKAAKLFEDALDRDPKNVEARFGLIKSRWLGGDDRGMWSNAVRGLAERDDLTPRQQYEVGLFAYTKLKDRALAAALWKAAKERDPKLANTVDIDTLLERASP